MCFCMCTAGPRVCLGKHVAMLEEKVLMCMILQRFRLRVVKGYKPKYRVTITLPIDNGLIMTVQPRSQPGQ